jgi:hypothetical protein
MSIKSLRERVEQVAQNTPGGVPPDYLPRFPRTLDGAVRCVLESHAKSAIARGEAEAPCENVESASDAELLAVQGFTPDLRGLVRFMWVKQHWIAVFMHNFKLPHNCGAYCTQRGRQWDKPYVPGALIFRSEYEKLVAEHLRNR